MSKEYFSFFLEFRKTFLKSTPNGQQTHKVNNSTLNWLPLIDYEMQKSSFTLPPSFISYLVYIFSHLLKNT